MNKEDENKVRGLFRRLFQRLADDRKRIDTDEKILNDLMGEFLNGKKG